MIYKPTDKHNEYILHPESFKERLRIAWWTLRYPNRIQQRITVTNGTLWMLQNCNKVILNETKNLTKVRE